jgi:hypothetical protein
MIIFEGVLAIGSLISFIILFIITMVSIDSSSIPKKVLIPIDVVCLFIMFWGLIYSMSPNEYVEVERHISDIKTIEGEDVIVQVVRNDITGQITTLSIPYKHPEQYKVTFILKEVQPFLYVSEKAKRWVYVIEKKEL